MPFNGSGTFTRLYSWVVDAANGVDISSSRTDAEMNGFAAGLTNCITRDGQSPPSADIPWGGKKLTNLGLATTSTDALSQAAGDARYFPLTGGTNLVLTGSLNAATLALSGNASVAGTTTLTGLVSCANYVTCTTNGTGFQLTDLSGTHPLLAVDTSNNLILYGTDATGAARSLFSIGMRSGTSTLNILIGATGQTPTVGDNSTKLATTAFVTTAIAAAAGAPLNSPAFTGTPTAPTASAGTSTTQIATTAFVMGAKNPAVQSVASASTVTPTFSNDLVDITAQAAALTLANPSGTAVNGWGIVIRIKDNGSAQTIAYGTQYKGIGLTLPTTTVAGKVLTLGGIWNANLTRLEIVSAAQE